MLPAKVVVVASQPLNPALEGAAIVVSAMGAPFREHLPQFRP